MAGDMIMIPGTIASGDHSTSQFYMARFTGSTVVDFEIGIISGSTQVPIGSLQNNPNSSGLAAEIIHLGVGKAQYGGTIAGGAQLGVGTDGRVIAITEGSSGGTTSSRPFIVAHALQNGTSGGVFQVLFVTPHISST